MGVAAALLLIGASVVFAGQALQPTTRGGPPPSGSVGQPTATSDASAPRPDVLPAAPQLDRPAVTLVTQAEIEVSGRLTEELPRDGRYRLRLYVNGELVRDRRLPRRPAFNLPGVPLAEGVNSISAAVHGPAGEGLHSTPIEVELDTTAPTITVLEPTPGALYAPEIVVRGTSEPGATLTATNSANQAGATLVVGEDGAFQLALALAPGSNEIGLEATDRAGNTGRTTVRVERREGQAGVSLSLSRSVIQLEALPVTMTLRARVTDAAGDPVDGAEVTLSLSPPGLPTLTHVDQTRAGLVTWAGVRMSSDGAQRGQGLATVLVVLPDGSSLQGSEFFTIE